MGERAGDDEERRRQAAEALERVRRDSETLGTPSMARAAHRARAHFTGADAERGDAVELWGRRIGRALSALAFVLLVLWLGAQLGWWRGAP